MDSEKIIEKLLNFELDIEKNIFKKIKFVNDILEEQFQEYIFPKISNHKNVSNILILLGYLATFIYIIFSYYKLEFVIVCLSCFFLSVISIIIAQLYKSRKMFHLHNHFQIFLSSINLTLKGIIVCLKYSPDSEIINVAIKEHEIELLRIIIYDFISTNVFLLTKLESNFKVWFYYMLQSLGLITLCIIKANGNKYFFVLEGMTSIFIFIIFYCLRREWDKQMRLIFAEKFKFNAYFHYSLDFINGLNALTVNIQNDNNIFYNQKFYDAISQIIKNNEIKAEYGAINLNNFQEFDKFRMNSSLLHNKGESGIKLFFKELQLYDFQKEHHFDSSSSNGTESWEQKFKCSSFMSNFFKFLIFNFYCKSNLKLILF